MSKIEDKIAEIIESLGEDDDVVEEVKNAVDFEDATRDIIKSGGPAREAVSKLILEAIRGMTLEDEDGDGTSVATRVVNAIDLSKLVKAAMVDPKMRDEMTAAVREEVLKDLGENEIFSEAVQEHFSFDAEMIGRILRDSGKEKEIDNALADEIIAHLRDNLILENCAGFQEAMSEIADERLKGVLQSSIEGGKINISQMIEERINGLLNAAIEAKIQSGELVDTVIESDVFGAALDRAVAKLTTGDRAADVVENVFKKLTVSRGELGEKFAQMLSERLLGAVAGKIVERLLLGR